MAGKKLLCLGPKWGTPHPPERGDKPYLWACCGRGTEAKLRLLLLPVPGLTSTQPPPEQQASSPQRGSRTVVEYSLQASCTSSPHTPIPRTQPYSHPPHLTGPPSCPNSLPNPSCLRPVYPAYLDPSLGGPQLWHLLEAPLSTSTLSRCLSHTIRLPILFPS